MTMTAEAQTPAGFDRGAYVEKVRKLLAKAEGASTQEEADAFFAKAQDLITKWEIDSVEFRALSTGPTEWVIATREYTVSSYSPKHDAYVINSVARGMGMWGYQVPYERGFSKGAAVVFGTEEDFERFEMMLTSIQLQLSRAMRAAEDKHWNRNQQRAFRLGFKMGYGQRIEERLLAARSKATGRSLVLAGKEDAIERAKPGGLRTTGLKGSHHGAAAGQDAANSADIGHGRVRGGASGAVTA
jgi:hypothetical protein